MKILSKILQLCPYEVIIMQKLYDLSENDSLK